MTRMCLSLLMNLGEMNMPPNPLIRHWRDGGYALALWQRILEINHLEITLTDEQWAALTGLTLDQVREGKERLAASGFIDYGVSDGIPWIEPRY
jgi:hypothetical protein